MNKLTKKQILQQINQQRSVFADFKENLSEIQSLQENNYFGVWFDGSDNVLYLTAKGKKAIGVSESETNK